MKTRTGFVSNSSSSSFVVTLKDPWLNIPIQGRSEERLAAERRQVAKPEDIPALVEYGFHFAAAGRASDIEAMVGVEPEQWPAEVPPEEALIMWYQVCCNEDEVIVFLLEHDIPFKAATHYGHYGVFYRQGDPEFLEVTNHGLIYEMYRDHAMLNCLDQGPSFVRHNVKEYIARERGLLNQEY